MRATGSRALRAALPGHFIVALLCAGCSAGGGGASPGAATTAEGGDGRSAQTSGRGAGRSGGGMGGSTRNGAGVTGSGSGGGLAADAGAGGREAAGRSGSGAAGAAGTEQTIDPCAGKPAGCTPLCEGGMCQCHCPELDPCPGSEPAENTACNTLERCGYGEPGCHRIFECFTGVWKKVADTCVDGPPGSCPATKAEALAVPCLDRRCGYDGQICQCGSQACSGVFMEPMTYCSDPTPAACLGMPKAGAVCMPEGQRCGATCCGLQFRCLGGKWSGVNLACPP